MSAAKIQTLVNCLGQTYENMLSRDIASNKPLSELYKGRERLALKVTDGIELSFFADSKVLERVLITLEASMPGVTVYNGELPSPFAKSMTQADVRTTFGDPVESRGPIKMPKPLGQTGGWDAYPLDTNSGPGTRVVFSYSPSLLVQTLAFVLQQ
ncbi:DUF6392 family protein [Pseudomonas sp. Irchel 3A18]|uniref:DUF6392 family protein n=1 Tax=Pseudomonas sp. Irchel 3A18 TaxID=2008905 RepID=UPI000BA4C85F|nr:DUF6392 family protein [Pseudomonas sp. Irchel 3A18]